MATPSPASTSARASTACEAVVPIRGEKPATTQREITLSSGNLISYASARLNLFNKMHATKYPRAGKRRILRFPPDERDFRSRSSGEKTGFSEISLFRSQSPHRVGAH